MGDSNHCTLISALKPLLRHRHHHEVEQKHILKKYMEKKIPHSSARMGKADAVFLLLEMTGGLTSTLPVSLLMAYIQKAGPCSRC